MKINEAWHQKNPMPQHATLEQRAQWHISHAKHCGCREMPESVKTFLSKRVVKKKKKSESRKKIV